MRCVYIKADGTQCKAYSLKGSYYCKTHTSLMDSDHIDRNLLLSMIVANGGSQGLDLSGQNLKGIDVSSDVLREIIVAIGQFVTTPLWLYKPTCGINLVGAILRNSKFNSSYMWRGNFSQADFKDAELIDCDLGIAILKEADLSGANFDSANLHDVNLDGAILDNTILTNTNLYGIDFLKVRIFKNVFLCGATLTGAKISRQLLQGSIGEENHGEFLKAKEVYLAIKLSFRDQGRYDDARWAYIQERRMERIAHSPIRAKRMFGVIENIQNGKFFSWGQWRFYIYHTVTWISNLIMEITTLYGESPFFILIWGLFIILTFPLFYFWSNGLVMDTGIHLTMIDYLQYSIAAFATMNLSGVTPINNCAKLLTNIEAILGIAVLALLMWALGNKVSHS